MADPADLAFPQPMQEPPKPGHSLPPPPAPEDVGGDDPPTPKK